MKRSVVKSWLISQLGDTDEFIEKVEQVRNQYPDKKLKSRIYRVPMEYFDKTVDYLDLYYEV